MQFVSTQKYIRMSPRKLRLVADQARSLSPEEALITLPLVSKRAAGPIVKVIKSAAANGAQAGVDINKLKFSEIQVTEGPRLKRGRPVSRGRWHPILKRMSHIRVVLETIPEKKSQIAKPKSQTAPQATHVGGQANAKSKIKNSRQKSENKKTVSKSKTTKGGK